MKNEIRLFLTGAVSAMVLLWIGVGCIKPTTGPLINTIPVTGIVPVLDIPLRPTLEALDSDELVAYTNLPESLRNKLQGNDKKLKIYAAQLQVAIEDYNTYAMVRNKTSQDEVGIKKVKESK